MSPLHTTVHLAAAATVLALSGVAQAYEVRARLVERWQSAGGSKKRLWQ